MSQKELKVIVTYVDPPTATWREEVNELIAQAICNYLKNIRDNSQKIIEEAKNMLTSGEENTNISD